jgi:hypothetical protein
LLVYDTETLGLERFDPNVISFGDILNDAINKCIETEMNRHYKIKKFYKPIDYCPLDKSFQRLQSLEKKQQGDPRGFCMWWSLWYLDLRLANAHHSREEIVEASSNIFSNKELINSMTDFIRGYGIELLNNYEQFIEQ